MFDIQFRATIGGPPIAADDIRLVMTDYALNQALFALVGSAVSPLFNGCRIKCFGNPTVFGQETVLADLSESTFPGYSGGQSVSWSIAGTDEAGGHVVVADLPAPEQVDTDPAGETLAGIYVLDSDDVLIAGAAISPPLALVAGMIIPMTLIVQIGNS